MIETLLVLAMAGGSAGAGPVAVEAEVLADARRRTGAAQVRVVRREAVTWRDGSLGCPEEGRLYTQALVPGWRLQVEADSKRLVYHASAQGRWLWCPPGRATDPLPGAAAR